ncbi:MAG: DUF47 family protein [Conexivisphaerales archaeon]
MKLFRIGLGGNGEDVILSHLLSHTELAMKASVRLKPIVEMVSDGRWEEAKKEYEVIDSLESEADEVHRDTVERLSTGVYFAGLGADLMDLAEKIDGIADSSKDSARTLIFRRLQPDEVKPLRDDICQFLSSCQEAVSSLAKAVEGIGKGKSEVIKHAKETEMYEEAADETKNKILEKLFQIEMPVLSTIQLRDFIFQADNVADYAEDAGDVLYILVAKGYY